MNSIVVNFTARPLTKTLRWFGSIHRLSYCRTACPVNASPQSYTVQPRLSLLNMEQLVVQSVLFHQRIVCPMFYQSAIVKNEDLIRVYNCTEAVGDHNNRLAFHQFGNRLLNQNFILRSRDAVASSSRIMGAFFSKARAMEIRWHSPPESVLPFSPRTV